jgi:3-hydroxybutyryl-CoA dehydrogenase
VVGAGFMGTVVATIYAVHGYEVALCDRQQVLLDGFADHAITIASALVVKEKAQDLLSRVS